MSLLLVAAAAAVVAGGVATNQVLDDGKLSWHWAYLAFGFMVLASVFTVHASQPSTAAESVARTTLGGRRRTYLRQLRASVMDMETIGIVTQGEFVLRMRQVYVQISLRPRAVQAAEDPGVGLLTQERTGERQPLRSFLHGGRVLAVIGASGSGKTTLARHTALAMCGWQGFSWRRRRLPVLLYLRDHVRSIAADEAPGLAEVATDVGWLDGKIDPAWMAKRLDKGRCLVLLDGLDEIADEGQRKRVVAWIRRQIERYPAHTFVITSRPHGYLSNPVPNADVLQVQRFDSDQIAEFLHHWYNAVECRARGRSSREVSILARRQADDLLEKLRSTPAVYELAANPLLLTMIANVHRYRSALPRSRAALYAEMCDVLIHRRQEAKDLTDPTGLDGPKKERVIRHLALHMMRGQARDVPLEEAQQAVRRPLSQVTGGTEVAPELFLTEVRKTGLLMGEHGAYGFAHLTLQEYLAAAHVREQADQHLYLLIQGVDDPWWRETTLLWAAASDATPVIEACLASGTLHALTLAFDCADEALEVSPGTRARLNELLTTSKTTDHDDEQARQRLRIIAAVTASRNLREVVWLGTNAVSAQPVSRDLYDLFASHERAVGRHTRPLAPVPAVAGTRAATGFLADDVLRFVAWLNTLFDDGTSYRLPAAAELDHPDAPLLSALARHTVWTVDGHQPVLHQPKGVPWPYAPTADQLAAFPGSVLLCLRPALHLAQLGAVKPDPRYLLAHMQAHAGSLDASSSRPPVTEGVVALSRAHELARTLDLAIGLTIDLRGADERYLGAGLNLAMAIAHALALDLEWACHLNEGVDLDDDGTLIRDLSNPGELHNVRKRIRDLVTRLDGACRDDPGVATLARDRDLARQYARSDEDTEVRDVLRAALRIDGREARNLDVVTTFARNGALVAAIEHARVITVSLGPPERYPDDIGRAKTLNKAREMSRDISRALVRDASRDVAWRISADLGKRYPETLTAVVYACRTLLRASPPDIWVPQSPVGHDFSRPWERQELEYFLTDLLAAGTPDMAHATEDPARTMRQAVESLGMSPDRRDHVAIPLVQQASALLTPLLNRTAPADPEVLAVAGAGLIAALVLLRAQAPQNDAVVSLLNSALGTIITVYNRSYAATPNETVFLVRN
ncbi:NACHT domain-containing protein [Actinomadura fulvescens]|uniref:NACHT domain-containing protein n=1 Tax=Actinomadura fulvescens TaxID=46160 RepID=A0ABN3PJ62_9ACTN